MDNNSETLTISDGEIKQLELEKRENFNDKDTDRDSTEKLSKVILNGSWNQQQHQLSKKQQKKLKKMQQWEEKKKEKRLKEREKNKKKRLEALAKGEPLNTGPNRKQLKKNKCEKSSNFLQVIIDLDFDDLMIDKDIAKCVKQLLRIYTINRRSLNPAKLHFCGIKNNGRIHKCLEKNDGYQNWDVKWYFQSFSDTFTDLNKLVYLTSDSDDELNELDENSIYIIGGLVDHNHMKGYCLDKAKKLGIKTARLPLSKYIDIKTRTVLCLYHVFEILLRISEGKTWTNTLLEVIPMRKGAKQKQIDNQIVNQDSMKIEEEINK